MFKFNGKKSKLTSAIISVPPQEPINYVTPELEESLQWFPERQQKIMRNRINYLGKFGYEEEKLYCRALDYYSSEGYKYDLNGDLLPANIVRQKYLERREMC